MENRDTAIHLKIEAIKVRLKSYLPQVRKEVRHYEQRLEEGKLIKNPDPSPQFGRY